DRVIPGNPSGLVIDGPQECPARNTIIRAGPPVGAVLGFEEINAVADLSAHDTQAGVRIKARRTEVGGAALVGRYQDATFGRILGWIWNWASLLIDSFGPVHRGEWFGQQTLATRPLEHEEVAIARGLHQQFSRLPVKSDIRQNWNFVGIPIVRIVRRGLEAPDEFPRIRVERNDAARPRIIAGPCLSIQDRRGIPWADIDQIAIWIVGAGGPHLASGGA